MIMNKIQIIVFSLLVGLTFPTAAQGNKVEKKDTQDTLLVKAGQDINIPDEPDRSPNSRNR